MEVNDAKRLKRLEDEKAKREYIVSDNGTDFTSKAILKCVNDDKIEWHYIDPGKAKHNGYIEPFNVSLRDECLNDEMFDSHAEARRKLALWR